MFRKLRLQTSRQRLKDVVDANSPDWTTIQQFVQSDRDSIKKVLFKPTDMYLLHLACRENAPSDFVIQLINDYPKACKLKDGRSYLPLHYACEYNQSEEVIQLLITIYPKACEEKDVLYGWLPLHCACFSRDSLQSELVIQLLVTSYPKACKEINSSGESPLHLACYCFASLSVIQLLVRQWPEALSITDEKNRTPLDAIGMPDETIAWLENYIANRDKILFDSLPVNQQERKERTMLYDLLVGVRSPDWTKIQQLVRANKSLIKNVIGTTNSDKGMYLLHYACSTNAPSDFVIELINEYPEACQKKSNGGWLPLHYACTFHHSESVKLLLIIKYPKACEEKTCLDDLPLHLEINQVKKSRSEAVIQLLITKYPKACQEKDFVLGQLPLHFACTRNLSESVIQSLITVYPKACEEKDKSGALPLHCACSSNQTESVIQSLITKYPKACQEKRKGYLPLHCACSNNQTESVIQLLITTYPGAVQEKTNDGLTPLSLACCSNASLSVIQLLVQQWPNALSIADKINKTPLDWAKNPENKSPNTATIDWLENYKPPSTIKQLFKFFFDSPSVNQQAEQKPNDQPSVNPSEVIEAPNGYTHDQRVNGTSVQKIDSNPTLNHPTLNQTNDQNTINTTKLKAEKVNNDLNNTRSDIAARKGQVNVTVEYIKSILTEKELGKGGFGTVYYGYDKVLQQDYAIKTINPEILLSGSPEFVQKTKETFLNEQKVLLIFRHPSIAVVLAYSFPETGTYYLLYEYAELGSLDKFWKDDPGREKLSIFRRRVTIAYEVMSALRFLHVGNKDFRSCYHRDIKSANIVLKNDFTAQLIDCGIASVVSDEKARSTLTSFKGSLDYACPEYIKRKPYDASCDIYSFGLVLVELFTGRLQNYEIEPNCFFEFYEEYIEMENSRNLVDDVDRVMGFDPSNLPTQVNDFAQLALHSMAPKKKNRPSGEEVMDRLRSILNDCNVGQSNSQTATPMTVGHTAPQSGCKICRTNTVLPDGSTCQMCLTVNKSRELIQESMEQNSAILKIILDAVKNLPKEIQTGNQATLHTLQKLSLDIGKGNQDIATLNDSTKALTAQIRSALATIIEKMDSMHEKILPALRGLDGRFNNSLPRLFILLRADRKNFWRNPKSFMKSLLKDRYHLYFICAHSYRAVGPPLKFYESHNWVKSISPVLAVSLYLISITIKATTSIDVSDVVDQISREDLNGMIEFTNQILIDNKFTELKNCLSERRFDPNNVNVLNNDAYDFLEKETKKQSEWKDNMLPVHSSGSATTMWVAKDVVLNGRLECEENVFL